MRTVKTIIGIIIGNIIGMTIIIYALRLLVYLGVV